VGELYARIVHHTGLQYLINTLSSHPQKGHMQLQITLILDQLEILLVSGVLVKLRALGVVNEYDYAIHVYPILTLRLRKQIQVIYHSHSHNLVDMVDRLVVQFPHMVHTKDRKTHIIVKLRLIPYGMLYDPHQEDHENLASWDHPINPLLIIVIHRISLLGVLHIPIGKIPDPG
jgi:hypothetical protein